MYNYDKWVSLRGDNSMKFTPNERDVLIEALELLFDERDLDSLTQYSI